MRVRTSQSGFSFTEVLVVIAILLILAAISFVTFQKLNTTSTHRVMTQEALSLLTEARIQSIASENDTVYGVRIATSSVTLFAGGTYNQSDPDNIPINFSGGVHATSSLSGGSVDIVFHRLTGFPSATGTIQIIRGDGLATNTITIHNSGLVDI